MLGRLLALARLTTAQALELGAGVLEAAAGDGAPGGAGCGEQVVVSPVVDVEGRVVIRSDRGRVGSPSPVGASGRPADAVLADVAAAARLPGADADPLLAELDRAARGLPVDGLSVVARRLQEAAAALDRPAIRAELAALVRAVGAGGAVGGVVVAHGCDVREPGGFRSAPHPPVPPDPRRTRSAGRRIGAWLLSLLVLAAVVVAEVVLLRDHITADVHALLAAGRSGDNAAAAPAADGPQLPPPAPAAAGNVAAVDLRPLGRCAPGASCTVRFLVRLVPSAEPVVVTWSYRVVDRCTGASAVAPGGTVTVPPRSDRAAAVGVVALPPLDGVAVFAVTDAPAVAASAPVVVGSCQAAGTGR